jgi:hypothetical protein
MRTLATLAAIGAMLAPSLVAAQGPATIRGRVYACHKGAPIGFAPVVLRSLDDGTVIQLVADEHGRFARVGVSPGRYLIGVTGILPRPGRRTVVPASRLARVESDDVLDVALGSDIMTEISSHTKLPYAAPLPPGNDPHPDCDPALVPPAPSTADRYIIH